MKFQLFSDIENRVAPANCWPAGMSGVYEQASGDSRIYLDFSSNAEGNEEEPVSSDGLGQVNKSFGKMAPCLLNLRYLFIVSWKKQKEICSWSHFTWSLFEHDISLFSLQSLQSDLLIFEWFVEKIFSRFRDSVLVVKSLQFKENMAMCLCCIILCALYKNQSNVLDLA